MSRNRGEHQIKPTAVIAAGLAAILAAFLTSRFGIAGTVLGSSLTVMLITALSSIFDSQLQRAFDRSRGFLATVHRRHPFRSATGRAVPVGSAPGPSPMRVYGRRRAVLSSTVLAAALSLSLGLGGITAMELGAGKSLSCWVWERCPQAASGAGASERSDGAPGAKTLPSVLGGGEQTAVPEGAGGARATGGLYQSPAGDPRAAGSGTTAGAGDETTALPTPGETTDETTAAPVLEEPSTEPSRRRLAGAERTIADTARVGGEGAPSETPGSVRSRTIVVQGPGGRVSPTPTEVVDSSQRTGDSSGSPATEGPVGDLELRPQNESSGISPGMLEEPLPSSPVRGR